MKDRILVFIPMYNCEKQIVRVLEQLNGEICEYISEVVIVNNRSTDDGEIVAVRKIKDMEFPFKVSVLRNRENYGLGGSHKVAFHYAIENGFDYCICLHGDDQGCISDFVPLLKRKSYREYDCCLGARFMRGAELKGYSRIRILGNCVFNWIFSIIVRRRIYDLGSGLNMYKISPLETRYYEKFPDTLYFNDCMILAYCHYGQKIKFLPITWREEDQVSNNKLLKFSMALFKMLLMYLKDPSGYMRTEMRTKIVKNYSAECIFNNEEE